MNFVQNTLMLIAKGEFMPDQEYVIKMATALLEKVFIVPRCDRTMRADGQPYWYDILKDGVIRGNIYHAASTNTFVVEFNGVLGKWSTFKTLFDAENYCKEYL